MEESDSKELLSCFFKGNEVKIYIFNKVHTSCGYREEERCMKNAFSDVPSIGSEQTYPIDGRQYGQSPSHRSSHPLSPDGSHEVCGTESFRLPSFEEWVALVISLERKKGGLT